MPCFTIPLYEFNHCHNPEGAPDGGRFCEQPHLPGGFERRMIPIYRYKPAANEWDPQTFELRVKGEVAGTVQYRIDRQRNAELDYLGIEKAFRNKGLGEKLYRAVANHVRKQGATHIMGDVTSAGILRLGMKILGNKPHISDAVEEYTPEKALAQLEPLSPENDEGVIDTWNHLTARWKLRNVRY